MAKRKRAAVMWWQAMRWTPPFGPSLPGYLNRDDESVPLDERTSAQLRGRRGTPPLRSIGTCLPCGARVLGATEPEWSRAVKQPCPRCGRPW